MGKTNPGDSADHEIVLERIFDAPCKLVWEAWTNPKHIAQWWGPDGFTMTIEKMDFRVGGVWKHVMHGPDGKDYPNYSVFREIVEHERIVFEHSGGTDGRTNIAFIATWTFEAMGNKTRLAMRLLFATATAREVAATEYGAIEGGRRTLARLEALLMQIARA